MRVMKLEKIAIKALYSAIVSSLSPASADAEKSDSEDSDEDKERPTKKIKLDHVVAAFEDVGTAREKLNKYLVASHRHYRDKLWQEFSREAYKTKPDMLSFLEAILDDKFYYSLD